MNNIFLILILIFASTKIKGKNICLCIYGLIGILVLSQFYDGYCNYIVPDTDEYTIVSPGSPACSDFNLDPTACNARADCMFNYNRPQACESITSESTFYDLEKLSRAYSCSDSSKSPVDPVGYTINPSTTDVRSLTYQDIGTLGTAITNQAAAGECSQSETLENTVVLSLPNCEVDSSTSFTCSDIAGDGSGTVFNCDAETNDLNPDATCAAAGCTPAECCTVSTGVSTRTCANISGDGTSNDPYDCDADRTTSNVLVASPESISCPSSGCTATECCPDVSGSITCGADFDCTGESNALNPDATCAGAECTAAECCTGASQQEQSTGNQTCKQFIDQGNNSQNYCRRYPNGAHNGQTAGWKYELPFQLLTEEPHHADLLDISYEMNESNVCTGGTCFGGRTNVNACTNPQSDECKDFKHDQEMCCKEKMPCYIHFMNNPQACPSGYVPKPDVTGFERTEQSNRDIAPEGSTPEDQASVLQMYENIASKNNFGRSNHLCDGDICDTENESSPDTPVCCMETFNCKDDVLLANDLNDHLDGFDEPPYLSLAFFDDVETIDDMCNDRNGVPASSPNEAWENVQERLLNLRKVIPGQPNDDGTIGPPTNVSPETIANDLCSTTSAWYRNEESTNGVGRCCTIGHDALGGLFGSCSPNLKIQP